MHVAMAFQLMFTVKHPIAIINGLISESAAALACAERLGCWQKNKEGFELTESNESI